ncbi:hypothetical protein IWQ60_000306 [Tieghemiomyces parasiticus]|uniref:Mediator of RNA polymerase II transcription subunit 4 n=1 Tax=Tieghemiomyces parasiticus TaxID=78921 RepID=A0A9W8AMH2_9FUNG|nr:hypothetical protein IWQ60_000306 [Tieghemiomyces parasiticus]
MPTTDVPLKTKLTDLIVAFRKEFQLVLESTQELSRETSKTHAWGIHVDRPVKQQSPALLQRIQRLVDLDKQLKAALAEVDYHQRLQKQVSHIQQAVNNQNQLVLDLVLKLTRTKESLETFIRNAERQVDAIERSEKNPVVYDDVIPYANKLSSFTAAPPNFDPNSGAVPAETPYPVEGTMRAGLLNQKRKVAVEAPTEQKETVPTLDIDAELMNSFMAHHDHQNVDEADLLDLDLNPDLE